ncbi:MAG: hypothetical protein KF686_18485 [Ramlibacter sp.]|nr:hypothetical protein [Ramlibacter sp.]
MPLRTVAIAPALAVPSESDIASVRFDGRKLSIEIAREPFDGDRFHGMLVTFREVQGFRLLDESDLTRYWASPDFVRGHHVVRVVSGGWCAEEDQRQGYEVRRREWLVVTGNRCLNVFASEDPDIEEGTYDAEA